MENMDNNTQNNTLREKKREILREIVSTKGSLLGYYMDISRCDNLEDLQNVYEEWKSKIEI